MRPQILERLDFVAKRIPGLKLVPIPNDYSCAMCSDSFLVEIRFDKSMQSVEDVLVNHESKPGVTPCPILKKVLVDQDYDTFAKHLSGFHSIYCISTSDKKVKHRAYPTLIALEKDLSILYDYQRRRINNCHDLVHKSPLGIMEPRIAGFPVKLTYFITPYDLVDVTNKGLINLTINNIIEKNLGLSATVEIEGSSLHKLQNKSLISTQHNSSLPQYAPFNNQNSEKLPAQFVLKLIQPFPMLISSINQIITEITEPATIKEHLVSLTTGSKESLINLVARQELDLNKGPFCRSVDSLNSNGNSCAPNTHVYTVKLLDQFHTYRILDNHLERQEGVYVTKIPFTHPTSIPTILKILRQQALFNFVIGSCIRRSNLSTTTSCNNNSGNSISGMTNANLTNVGTSLNSDENSNLKYVPDEANIFDVIPVNLNTVCVSFEHPSKESLATLEIDFKEFSCQLYALEKESVCTNEFATKVMQKCWSIPITLRSVLKKCNERRLALLEDANKRRERELQELLANSTNQQVGLNFKSNLPYQESILQSKFTNLNEKSNSHDLNSIAEFLTSKINVATTSETCNQTRVNNAGEPLDSRSSLLKKFSCKPKAKQNPATKNQTGNKILSLMLKRPNTTPTSVEDTNLKATLTKKAKTKTTIETGTKNFTPGLSTTKLISPEVANAARLASKQAKQSNSTGQLGASLSLTRSPNKSSVNPPSLPSASIQIGVSMTPNFQNLNSKHHDSSLSNSNTVNPLNVRARAQSNGSSSTNTIGKSRKGSIVAVLDKLVGGVTPQEQDTLNSANESLDANNKNTDSPKNGSSGPKSKVRTPGDQFAIKQGTVGSLKLTVTKTKPTGSSPAAVTLPGQQLASSSSSVLASTSSSSSNSTSTSSKNDANKVLGLATSSPTIKYTIPKLSKTQQASQSVSSQANSTENSNSSSSDSNSQGDDSANPSSTAGPSTASSTTTNKRITSTPFGRPNNSMRNPVSSSTHPPGRTTSNPLAGSNRPSSTSSNDNHLLNRISSSNQSQQMRQQMNNRNNVNIQQVQHPQPIQPMQQTTAQRILSTNIIPASTQQPAQHPMFAVNLAQVPLHNTTDLNVLGANQVAMLNQQRQMNSMQNSLTVPFMSSSVEANLISSSKSHLPSVMAQGMNSMPTVNNITPNVGDSMQRPSSSIVNTAPQFYVRQPMFDDPGNVVSSTPRIPNEISQSSFVGERKSLEAAVQPLLASSLASAVTGSANRASEGNCESLNEMSSTSFVNKQSLGSMSNQGVSSSSDTGNLEAGPSISTPSSPTECGQMDIIQPPPLIPIDSLDEAQVPSPDTDHPDDASDRLSIVDTNENILDNSSIAGTPKPNSVNSPLNQDSNSATPSSSSRSIDNLVPLPETSSVQADAAKPTDE